MSTAIYIVESIDDIGDRAEGRCIVVTDKENAVMGAAASDAAEETTRYQTLEGALACLIEDFSLSGIRANPDQPSLFNGHQP